MQVCWHRHARAWAANVMEADSTRGCLENSASGGLAIAKTAAATVSASTSGRGAGAKTAVQTGYRNEGQMNARAWAANAMEANSAGGSLVNSEAGGGNVLRWQQPLRAQQLARIACVLAFALHTAMTIQYTSTHNAGTIDVVVRFEHTSGWGQSAEIPVVALSAITSGREGFVKNEAAAASAHQCRGKDALTVERSRTRQRN
eukprot:CAMPEP_0173125812 /NCGR_PEP_ID=MMETSP1102-20130122/56675_1 /TAXON_ID=49646 /ORGANISM="Geminigera sp., Strain Caron Lab Isolate" /LENGTH=201 /DNA_ID=CAMNT_0014034823 /DNA_START=217 /DNA_END=823 /DNA_ORIENTATION=-